MSSSPTTTEAAAPKCTTAAPGPNGHIPPDACNALYAYDPSFVAAILFSVLFGLATLGHLIGAFAWRKPFCWVVIMGCAWETASFTLRTLSTRDQDNLAYYIPSIIIVLLAPIWINAFVYMVLGRMIYFYLPSQSIWRIRAVRLATMFVWLDIFSFFVQLGGGSLVNPEIDPKIVRIGVKVYQGGIAVQEFFLVVFTAIAIRFHVEMVRLEREGAAKPRWKLLITSVYTASGLITVRIIYRLVELSPGTDRTNQLLSNEWYFYVLEALPMFLAAAVFAVIHPGLGLRGSESEFPTMSRKEKKAKKREKKQGKKEEKQRKKEEKQERKQRKKEEKQRKKAEKMNA